MLGCCAQTDLIVIFIDCFSVATDHPEFNGPMGILPGRFKSRWQPPELVDFRVPQFGCTRWYANVCADLIACMWEF